TSACSVSGFQGSAATGRTIHKPPPKGKGTAAPSLQPHASRANSTWRERPSEPPAYTPSRNARLSPRWNFPRTRASNVGMLARTWISMALVVGVGCAAPVEQAPTAGYVLLDREARAKGSLTVGSWRGAPVLPIAAEEGASVLFQTADDTRSI